MTNTHEENKAGSTHKRKALYIIVGVVLAVVLGLIIWLYTGSVTSAKRAVFSKTPLPVAMVSGKFVISTDLIERVNLAKVLLSAQNGDTSNLEGQILDQLIETKKIEVIAANKDVKVSDEDLDNAFDAVVKQFPSQSKADLEKELQSKYGINLNTFKTEVLKQTVTTEKLSLWYNSQESLNPEAYTTARDLLAKLNSGEDFATVANNFSEDPASKIFAGDSGFVNYSDLLPEFQEAVKNLVLQDTKIVASRFGVHVIKLNAISDAEGSDTEKSYNIQQIFLAPNDFNRWLQGQTSNVSSYKFL